MKLMIISSVLTKQKKLQFNEVGMCINMDFNKGR